MLGTARLDLGDLSAARTALEHALPVSIDIGDRWIVPIGLAGFAGLAAKTGRPRLALRLTGAAEAYQDANKLSMPDPVMEMLDRWLAPARAKAGPAAERLLAEGRQLGPEEAVAVRWRTCPRKPCGQARAGRSPAARLRSRRSRRAGLTNRDIATQLFLSVRTVEVHVDHILTKLGFHTRTQLAAWAYEAGLRPEDT